VKALLLRLAEPAAVALPKRDGTGISWTVGSSANAKCCTAMRPRRPTTKVFWKGKDIGLVVRDVNDPQYVGFLQTGFKTWELVAGRRIELLTFGAYTAAARPQSS
jgi:hypothetical protein